MKFWAIYFLLTLFVLGQYSCARRKTFQLREDGKIARTISKYVKYSDKLGGLYDIDYYLLYKKNLSIKDSIELRHIANNFIRTIKRRKIIPKKHLLDTAPLVFQNNSLAYLAIDTRGWRDFTAKFEVNLKKQQMHYVTTSGF